MSKLLWNKDIDPETEDRKAFLKLSYSERWSYMMALILSNHPTKKPTNHKKIIKWP
ncbi:hypothetical protein [Reichenbachiella sp. MALMAid0571]|uniref:hypothetical protein n=1 Tax=Reichenbachiella sp. MALMAid0571 TaxID=3143939 RepID=UPI0032E01F47